MRVLIVSAEVWRNDKNGGNVLTNIFRNMDAEFAQIYCNPGIPDNSICNIYYQMTDGMVIRNLLKRQEIGNAFVINGLKETNNKDTGISSVEQENKRIYSFFRRYSFEVFHVMKEIAWLVSNWDNDNLKNFILEFSPDIIFAPCYGSHIMLKIDRFVANLTQKPVISYISDDHYTLRQFRCSPVYWINRLVLRKNLKRTFSSYDLIYTMTDEQREVYEKKLNCKMKILKKSGDFHLEKIKQDIHNPMKMIYAGGLYCGRAQTLMALVEAIKKINSNETKVVLHVYTASELKKDEKLVLDDKKNSFLHDVVSQDELKRKYADSDMALHIESFELQYRLQTRLSFSTKIMDCLESGCLTIAIADSKQAGYRYIKKNRLGICIDNVGEIETTLRHIIEHPDVITTYSKRTLDFGVKNHSEEQILAVLENDFKTMIRKE